MPAKSDLHSLRARRLFFYKAIQRFFRQINAPLILPLQRVAYAEGLPLDAQRPDSFYHAMNLPGFNLSHDAFDSPVRIYIYQHFGDTQGPECLHHAAGVPDLDQLDHACAAHFAEALIAEGPSTAITSPGIAPEVYLAMVPSPRRRSRISLVDALRERARCAEQEADR